MAKKMVKVATFNDSLRAHFTRSRLEDADIYVEVRDEHLVQADPLLGAAVGGIKVLVPEHQVQRAAEILADERDGSLEGGIPESASGLRCPECGGREVNFSQGFHTWVALCILTFVLPFFFPDEGIWINLRYFAYPLFLTIFTIGVWAGILRKFSLRCADCGHAAKRPAFEPTFDDLEEEELLEDLGRTDTSGRIEA